MRNTSRTYLAALLLTAVAAAASAQTSSLAADRVIRMSGALPTAAGRPAGATTPVDFAVYDAETGGALLWQETQVLAVDAGGGYTVLLGASTPEGLPADLFAGGTARWLSVSRTGTAAGSRTLLTAVPYAMSAVNADTLGGRPAADFMLVPSARAAASSGDGTTATTTIRDPGPLVNNGTTGFIGKFFNTVDLDNSALFQSGSNVGLGTTTPFDALHTRFLNTAGSATGYAVQNLGSTANSYSGMLFYDHTGALRQFQGYNNGTGEYRINNISPTASINFMTGSNSRFKVATSGDIGLGSGTITPSQRLENYGTGQSDVTFISRRHGGTISAPTATGAGQNLFRFEGAGHNGTAFTGEKGLLQIIATETWTPTANGTEVNFATTANGTTNSVERLTIANSGNVGIGNSNPVRARLEVGLGGTYAYGLRGVLNTGGATSLNNAGSTTNNSIFADGFIWSDATFAISDARIKNIKGRSDGASDLSTLMGVRITDYAYIDTMVKGTGVQKKVIAQELEEVFPQAVRRGLNVVPDVYAMGTMSDGWVTLATDLKKGDRVRLHLGTNSEVYEVLEVGNERFRSSLTAANGTEVFVYGREVDDFRVVDYEAVSMLNVSATQELYRKIQQHETETAALRQELAEMRTALTAALEAVAAAARVRQ